MGAIQIENGPVYPFLKNQRGQSIVEYSLLLLITIAIATAAGIRLFKPASQWVDFYLGTYTQCLLDSGELPKMAGGNPQECDDLPGNPNAPGGANDPNNPENQKENANTNGSGKDKAGDSLAGAGGTGSGSGSRGRGGRNVRRGGRSFTSDQANVGTGGSDSAQADANSGKEKVRLVGSSTGAGAFANRNQNRTRYVGLSGLVDEEKKRIQKREERISKATEVEPVDFRTQKKLTLKPPERKVATDDQEIEGFSFGGLLRMIIIGGILIITVVIIGTQLNSISKSMDK